MEIDQEQRRRVGEFTLLGDRPETRAGNALGFEAVASKLASVILASHSSAPYQPADRVIFLGERAALGAPGGGGVGGRGARVIRSMRFSAVGSVRCPASAGSALYPRGG